VKFDRVFTDGEFARNSFVRLAFCHQAQYLQLARRQFFNRLCGRWFTRTRYRNRQCWIEYDQTLRDCRERHGKVFGRGVAEEQTARPG